ncbi:GNAT family N-acetyltransferase [Singulisphaera rosea]
MPRIDVLPQSTPEDHARIVAPLDEFSRGQGFVWQPEPVVLALRDESGAILGGLIGNRHWGWLRIDILAVDGSLRGEGWGSRLVLEAESLAIASGCHHAWVDTFSFQARPFYERLGYRVFGELADYPTGETRYFLSKSLRDPSTTQNLSPDLGSARPGVVSSEI